jgi:hypothetical protein
MSALNYGETSELKGLARRGAAFYLLTFVGGGVAQILLARLLVTGNAPATGANIVAHPAAFWASVTAYILVVIFYVAVTVYFYFLFRRVNHTLSAISAALSIVGGTVQAALAILLVASAAVLGPDAFLNAVPLDQRHAVAYLLIKVFSQGLTIPFGVFGVYCIIIGYLAYHSGFVPRAPGVLMLLGGIAWSTFLFFPLSSMLDPYIRIPGVVGEASLTLWLLVVGARARNR